jgi:hypothetical protein
MRQGHARDSYEILSPIEEVAACISALSMIAADA